ncbi:MAG: hypothetical protein M1820_008848 [Bogoriella megaspora]|nr:MAG: hypothetical protein M1820_008848 [Bogoriella megaspora]
MLQEPGLSPKKLDLKFRFHQYNLSQNLATASAYSKAVVLVLLKTYRSVLNNSAKADVEKAAAETRDEKELRLILNSEGENVADGTVAQNANETALSGRHDHQNRPEDRQGNEEDDDNGSELGKDGVKIQMGVATLSLSTIQTNQK